MLRRAVSDLPGVELVRRPICVPRERGLMIAGLLGGKENKNAGSYNREDCRRWSERFAIPMSYPDPDVFHERAQRWAAERAGLDPKHLMAALNEPGPAAKMRSALEEFERLQCPGVPTVIVDGRRFFGKDRVDWVADFCRAQAAVHQTVA